MSLIKIGRLRLVWTSARRPKFFFMHRPLAKNGTRFVDIGRLRIWVDGSLR